MAYAIVDKRRYRGAFHNAALRLGRSTRLYYFSLSREFLEEDPPIWIRGTVYLLPKRSFKPIGGEGFGSVGQEWRSPVPVRPLARLGVDADDFPLLDQVHGHDDRVVRRRGELRQGVLREVFEATPLEDGYELLFEPRDGLLGALAEFVEIECRFFPWLTAAIQVAPEGKLVTLRLNGARAMRDAMQDDLSRISGERPPDE